uniref:Uncharacterized protein n=1 Tax=Papilio polytes TaxID=76194 RepID=I4DSD0_PAPPL|nr:unknown unsecreted protein [Papilio polytes]
MSVVNILRTVKYTRTTSCAKTMCSLTSFGTNVYYLLTSKSYYTLTVNQFPITFPEASPTLSYPLTVLIDSYNCIIIINQNHY